MRLFNELFPCGYRRFCSPWWKHWFSWGTWYYGLKHGYQRIVQGYSFRDCWSIDGHLCDILPGMLERLEKTDHSTWSHSKKGKRDFIQMREGFKAAKRLLDLGPEDDYTEPWPYYERMGMTAQEWNAYEMRRFNNGMRVFIKRFFQLWD